MFEGGASRVAAGTSLGSVSGLDDVFRGSVERCLISMKSGLNAGMVFRAHTQGQRVLALLCGDSDSHGFDL